MSKIRRNLSGVVPPAPSPPMLRAFQRKTSQLIRANRGFDEETRQFHWLDNLIADRLTKQRKGARYERKDKTNVSLDLTE